MIIDGKQIADTISQEIKERIANLKSGPPCLAVIAVGNHMASKIYIKRKIQACLVAGIKSIRIDLPENIKESALIQEINNLNQDKEIHGILVQLPLPHHLNPLVVNEHIAPEKDVDGLNPVNMGRLLMGKKGGFAPCTPLGIQKLLEACNVNVTGKHVVILGRSLIVGKPTALLFLQDGEGGNATVTVLHSKSTNIPTICRTADIIIAAIGKPHFLKKEMVKEGAIVIDVGINRIEDPSVKSGYQIVGDVDFDALKDHCSLITPVPGGVGPMTIAMLLSNTLQSYLNLRA